MAINNVRRMIIRTLRMIVYCTDGAGSTPNRFIKFARQHGPKYRRGTGYIGPATVLKSTYDDFLYPYSRFA